VVRHHRRRSEVHHQREQVGEHGRLLGSEPVLTGKRHRGRHRARSMVTGVRIPTYGCAARCWICGSYFISGISVSSPMLRVPREVSRLIDGGSIVGAAG